MISRNPPDRTDRLGCIVTDARFIQTVPEEPTTYMPRKPNYGFDKRRKEQDRKAKKDAKVLDRQRRREEEASQGSGSEADGTEENAPSPSGPDADRPAQ
jgi:hypothetical protein